MRDLIIQDVMTIPSLKRGQVWCTVCGSTRKVDAVGCFQSGWPKCCGYTMTIDSPEERKTGDERDAALDKIKSKCIAFAPERHENPALHEWVYSIVKIIDALKGRSG
jgi:hypothetical protein